MQFPLIRLLRSPDPEESIPPAGGNTADDGAASDVSLPRDADDLAYQGNKVADHWVAHPDITMVDQTPDDFRILVTQFQTALGARKSAGAGRSIYTNQLLTLDDSINTGVSKIKAYLVGKYEDEDVAKAHYGIFGIVNESGNFRLPHDQQDRLAALDLTIAAIASEGFGSKEYGTSFWTNMRSNYRSALNQATGTDSTVGGDVADIAPLEESVRYVLTGLRFILRGNYQKTFRQVWREWGFLAEHN